jgi:REP element-mobilizing transposase RayT
MARQNRRDLFDPQEVGIYHCIQRAVRRAWLCGQDPLTGRSFEHRRDWLQKRLANIAADYGLDVLAFAVMANHLHVVVRNRPDVVATWTDDEVVRRWWNLFPMRRNPDRTPAVPTESELKSWMTAAKVRLFRSRLSDISWFMRSLCEPIARRSNLEDQCTGRFWEGRFRSQKLVDEAAVLACTAYVDLNPVRAGIVETPEQAPYTSAYERTKAEKAARLERVVAKRRKHVGRRKRAQPGQSHYVRSDAWLTPVRLDERAVAYLGAMASPTRQRASDKGFLAMSLETYLQFLDWTGRQIRRGHLKGRIPDYAAPILKRLGLEASTWCECVKGFGNYFKRVAGSPMALANEAKKRGQVCFHTRGSPLAAIT